MQDKKKNMKSLFVACYILSHKTDRLRFVTQI